MARPALKITGSTRGTAVLVFDDDDLATLAAALAPLVARHLRGDTRPDHVIPRSRATSQNSDPAQTRRSLWDRITRRGARG